MAITDKPYQTFRFADLDQMDPKKAEQFLREFETVPLSERPNLMPVRKKFTEEQNAETNT